MEKLLNYCGNPANLHDKILTLTVFKIECKNGYTTRPHRRIFAA